MNLYDFDNTIIKGDSSNRFFWYSLLRHPFIVFISICKALLEVIKSLFGKSNFSKIKSSIFSYVKYINNLDDFMDKYASKNLNRIKKFYLDNQKDNDVIISASFEFIVKPFCDKLGIKNLIATKYDIKTGKIIGNNCKGSEKVKRFYEIYSKETDIEEAYSDSLSDIPMLELAKKAYIVKDNRITDYLK